MFRWTICPKQLIITTGKEMPVSVLSIKDQGQRQSIPYNCSDSNSKWTRCVKARFVRILEELETIFPSIISRIFALGDDTQSRRRSLGFWKDQFQDFLPSDHHFRPSLSIPGPSTQNVSDSQAEPHSSHASRIWIHFHALKNRSCVRYCAGEAYLSFYTWRFVFWRFVLHLNLNFSILMVTRWIFEVFETSDQT